MNALSTKDQAGITRKAPSSMYELAQGKPGLHVHDRKHTRSGCSTACSDKVKDWDIPYTSL